MKKLFVILIVSSLFVAISCGTMKKNNSGGKSGTGIANTNWKLISIPGFEMENVKPVTLYFIDSSKRIAGNGGCNGYGGGYQVAGNSLKFGQTLSTKMYCSNGGKTESKYLSTLPLVDNYKMEGGHLVLLQGKDKVLEFEPFSGEK